MARPRGHILNSDAFDDLLEARGRTRTEIAEEAGIALSTLSGMSKIREDGTRVGASLAVALRLAAAMKCKPGTLFPSLEGKTSAALAS